MKTCNQYLSLTRLVIIGLFISALSSCKDNTPEELNLGNSNVLLINSAASSSGINLYSTGNKVNTVPLVYGTTSGFRAITSGVRNIQIKDNGSKTLLATNTVHLLRDSSYTLFVYEANNATTTVIASDNRSVPSFGNAKIKFANLSSGLSSADLKISNGPVIASSVSFGTIGSYAEIKAGTYNLNVVLHGTNTILLTIPNVRMDNGKIYTIWSGGTMNGKGPSTLAVQTIAQ